MKRTYFYQLLAVTFLLLFACGQKSGQELDAETYSGYVEKGSEISEQAQNALLTNVSNAMQQGGSLYAVEFCNLQASSIIDSLNTQHNCVISRVSNKNRNPENALETEHDKQLWRLFFAHHQNGETRDTLVQENGHVVYYKPIATAMPACLQCHGPVEDIDPETFQKLQELYPNDRATGYGMNELRGMWKIEFEP